MSDRSLFAMPAKSCDEWLTPRHILEALGHFDLDPCAADTCPARVANAFFTAANNGLAQTWTGRVFVNPPFSNAAPWMDRAANYGNAILLAPAGHETENWYRFVWGKADAVLLLKGRTKFLGPEGTVRPGRPRTPGALVAYGKANADKLRVSGLSGVFIPWWVAA